MENTRLINLLKSFSADELREFELFVTSPFATGKCTYGFIRNFKQHYPEFTGMDFNKEKISPNFFLERNSNDPLLRNTFSDLLKLCEEYLKISQFRQDKFYSRYLLLKQLTNRKQE
ncbi:MAG: hypothetical protein IPP52_16115 [Ignavibacteria bacterium]|nr:hypothetical protein [Ignavibacteria bacterium]